MIGVPNALKATGAVENIAESSNPVTEVWFNSKGFNWKGKDPNLQEDFVTVTVTHDYGKTMGWSFVGGRDFSRDFSTDSSGLILNEAAVNYMGLHDPVHEEIVWNGKQFHIIGIVKDVVMTSPFEPVKQTIFWLDYQQTYMINIRLNPSWSPGDALSKIEKVFQSLMPSVPFDYKFAPEIIDSASEEFPCVAPAGFFVRHC